MFSLRKLVYGSASNILRLVLSVLVATVLPPLLVRHLSQPEYSAWVLILQLSAYIALLDFGLQTVTAKLVAEHHALEDHESNHRILSSSVSLLAIIAVVGIAAVLVLSWRVPELFHQMPAALIPQVRLSLLLIGCSAAIALPFNPFIAVFTGLQEYGFPTAVALVGRLLSAILLACMIVAGRGLVQLATTLALINLLTAVAQWVGWRRYARTRIAFTAFSMDRAVTKQLLQSGGVLALWTLGGMFVSGLDVMIVGHYDYGNTGFYSIGANATNFMLLCISSLFSPLLPAVSAMQTSSDPKAIGDLTIRSSRFCTILLCAIALPLAVFAFPLLSLWVGHTYALRSTSFLRLLILGNLIRQLGYPYSTVVIATGRQHLASIATVSEAVVNVIASLWLVHHLGAIGVAYGTLIGAAVSIGLHLTISMRATRKAIDLSPWHFAADAILRPLLCTLPALAVVPFLRQNSMLPAPLGVLAACSFAVLFLLCFLGLTRADRTGIKTRLARNRGVVHV